MLIRALLFDNFLDPPALVGQHVKRIHNRSGNSEDEKQLNHEETALSFERFDDIEGRNLLSYLLVGHHESIVAGSGSEVNDVPNNEDQTQKNDQNKGTCNHNGHSNSQGVLASLEKNLWGGCCQLVFVIVSAGVGPGRIGNITKFKCIVDWGLRVGWHRLNVLVHSWIILWLLVLFWYRLSSSIESISTILGSVVKQG